MDAVVWVDGWQMQCCGEPFTAGSSVSWTAVADSDTDWLVPVIGKAEAAAITHAEEHHSDGLDTVAGAVRAIRAVHCKLAPKPGGNPQYNYPVEGSASILPVERADGWDTVDGLDFRGYLVDLEVTGTWSR